MRGILRNTALLALPSLINAVALSDMTPRATGLPRTCNDIYTAQIAGCSASDFQTLQCSESCIGALEALVKPIISACGGRGVQGENLVVAFLAGVGPEQVCHNINAPKSTTTSTTSHTPTTKPKVHHVTHSTHPTRKPKIVSSTSTASSSPIPSSLLVDKSSTTTQTSTHTTHKTHKKHKHTKVTSSSSAPPASSSQGAAAGAASSSQTQSSKTASSSGNYQTNMHDGSGGGSPFDTPGNLMHNAASSFSISAMSVLLSAGTAAILFFLR